MTDRIPPRPDPPPAPPPTTEQRTARALERIADELEACRKVLETIPDRRDLIESFVAAALVVSPTQHTPEELAVGVRRVSDAVWAAIHGAAPAKPDPSGGTRG